ncbi:DUF488 domain-containing protein [Marixanthomonas sp. SCSIO 43207]|nr:DUF488 domain-containing protein [Marixanthomonas sp. SCSIO 43207]
MTKKIWTIGHSKHSIDDFLNILKFYKIECLIDVRSSLASVKDLHFTKENLKKSLLDINIEYSYSKSFVGEQRANPISKDYLCSNNSVRDYAFYMETAQFKESLKALEKIAVQKRTIIMCTETVWWRCHRSMISDALKANDWTVIQIISVNKGQEHPYTQPADIVSGKLSYKIK